MRENWLRIRNVPSLWAAHAQAPEPQPSSPPCPAVPASWCLPSLYVRGREGVMEPPQTEETHSRKEGKDFLV